MHAHSPSSKQRTVRTEGGAAHASPRARAAARSLTQLGIRAMRASSRCLRSRLRSRSHHASFERPNGLARFGASGTSRRMNGSASIATAVRKRRQTALPTAVATREREGRRIVSSVDRRHTTTAGATALPKTRRRKGVRGPSIAMNDGDDHTSGRDRSPANGNGIDRVTKIFRTQTHPMQCLTYQTIMTRPCNIRSSCPKRVTNSFWWAIYPQQILALQGMVQDEILAGQKC